MLTAEALRPAKEARRNPFRTRQAKADPLNKQKGVLIQHPGIRKESWQSIVSQTEL